jgi:galactonate dehydratase
MKIDNVQTYRAHNWLFVVITTDTGLVGVGESTLFGFPDAVASIVASFAERLRGQDPMRAEYHFLSLYRAHSMRGMAVCAALSAIDQALWDIKGKALEVPVWELLGGRVRDKVRAMLVLTYGTPEEVAAQAAAAAEAGYTAVKVLLFQPGHHLMRHAARVADLVERAALVREAVGDEIDIGIELHRNMSPGEAIAAIGELERFRPLFVEDPIPPDSVLSLGAISEKVRVPMAAGERNTTIWEFREYLEAAGVHYVRPDVGIAGGIAHTRKICALAEAHHAGVIPHAVPAGPVAVAANVQLGLAVPNWEVQEHRVQDAPPWTTVVKAIVPVVDGFFLPPEAPGLGIELDLPGVESLPAAAPVPATPAREDGAVAFR